MFSQTVEYALRAVVYLAGQPEARTTQQIATVTKVPGAMTIWDVVQAVEPIRRIETCPLELESHKMKLCPLHKKLDDALAQIEEAFRETTLADILAEPTTSKPLCPFPYNEETSSNGRVSLK